MRPPGTPCCPTPPPPPARGASCVRSLAARSAPPSRHPPHTPHPAHTHAAHSRSGWAGCRRQPPRRRPRAPQPQPHPPTMCPWWVLLCVWRLCRVYHEPSGGGGGADQVTRGRNQRGGCGSERTVDCGAGARAGERRCRRGVCRSGGRAPSAPSPVDALRLPRFTVTIHSAVHRPPRAVAATLCTGARLLLGPRGVRAPSGGHVIHTPPWGHAHAAQPGGEVRVGRGWISLAAPTRMRHRIHACRSGSRPHRWATKGGADPVVAAATLGQRPDSPAAAAVPCRRWGAQRPRRRAPPPTTTTTHPPHITAPPNHPPTPLPSLPACAAPRRARG